MADYAKTQAVIASEFGVSRQTVSEWARSPDFPPKTKKGWNLDRLKKWTEKNGKGEFRKGSGGTTTNIDGLTLTEVKIRLTVEQAENERIKKERQLVEQAIELGDIVRASDVISIQSKMVATVVAVLDAMGDVTDRTIPEPLPDNQTAYDEMRERVMALCSKLKSDVYAAMQEID